MRDGVLNWAEHRAMVKDKAASAEGGRSMKEAAARLIMGVAAVLEVISTSRASGPHSVESAGARKAQELTSTGLKVC